MAAARFRVGMVGVGDITMLHAPAYVGCEEAGLAALCDVDAAQLERRSRAWGVPRTYTDYRELLAQDDIDIVEVNLPHHLHERVVIAALEAGKHVACQKPIATTLAEGEAMAAAAVRSPGQLRILENFVYYPPYVTAKQLIDSGEIGEVLSVRFKLGTGLFGSRWVPLRSELWHLMEVEQGRGQTIFDDGYHKLSLAIHLVGPVEAVKGFIGRSFAYIDEPAQLIWRYAGRDTLGSFDVAFSPNLYTRSAYFPADERVDIVGSEGRIRLTGCTAQLIDEAPLVLYKGGRRICFDELERDWQASFTAGIRDFPRALREGRQAMLSAERALDIVRFAYALTLASALGTEVRPAEVTDEWVRTELVQGRGPRAELRT